MNSTEIQSESINELATALSLAQAKFETASKDSKAHYGKYADLKSVWEAARGPLTENGLSIVQTIEITSMGQVLVTQLLHKSGQWIKGHTLLMLPPTCTMQIFSAAVTYARRFSLSAMIGIVPEDPDLKDDDGDSCSNRKKCIVTFEGRLSKEQIASINTALQSRHEDWKAVLHKLLNTEGCNSLVEVKADRFSQIMTSICAK